MSGVDKSTETESTILAAGGEGDGEFLCLIDAGFSFIR